MSKICFKGVCYNLAIIYFGTIYIDKWYIITPVSLVYISIDDVSACCDDTVYEVFIQTQNQSYNKTCIYSTPSPVYKFILQHVHLLLLWRLNTVTGAEDS